MPPDAPHPGPRAGAPADSAPPEREPRGDGSLLPPHGLSVTFGEEQFRRLLLSLPAAVYTTDAEGRITLFNERAAALWGRRPEIGKDLWYGSWRIFHPDGTPLPHDQCPMAAALREGRSVPGEEIVVERPDGTRAHVLASPEPLFDASGALVGAVNMLTDVTPQKRAERDRALLAAIVESSDDVIVSKSLDGTITSWNAGAERILGYTAEEAVGQSIRMLIPPERQDEEDLILDRIGRGERVEHFETVRVRKDGRPLDLSLTISPIRDEDGRIIGASKVGRDVTEQKRTEAALRESEARFSAMTDSAPMLVWMAGTDGRFDWFNAGWLGFTGRTMEQELGDGWAEGLHPEDRDYCLETYAAAFAAREPFEVEFRLRRPDGEYRWLLNRGVPRYAPDGAFLGFIGSCLDIHERKRGEYVVASARRRAEQAERHLRAIIDHLPELAWWAQPDGRIDFFNQRWYEYTGLAAEAMAAGGWEQVHDPAFQPAFAERWQHALLTGDPFEMELPLRGADGTFRWFLTRAQPLRDRTGRIDRWVGINVDIHDKRRAEAQARFLAQSGVLVEQALDYDAALEHVAALAVPGFSDWCAVDLLHDDGSISAIAIAHADPDKVRWGWALRERQPVDPDAPTGAPYVIRTGESELYSHITEEMIQAVVQNEEELRLVREVGFSSVITVPLRAGGDVIGAITFVNAESGRHFDEMDLATAEEVGRRAGAALETARLHRALQESEARFRAISELTSDFAYAARLTADGDFEREWVSGAYRHITGYDPEEIGMREPWRELVHPDDLGVGEQRNEALRNGQPGISEHRLVTKDGAVRWVRDYARPELDAEGRVVRVVGAVQDITERKVAEVALRESEGRFRQIAEALPQIVYILPADRTGDTEYLNPRWYEYTGLPEGTGYAAAEAAGFPGVVHPDDMPRVRQMWATASETGALVELELRLRRHDGAYRWFLTRLVPVRDADGAVGRWFGTSTDIHAQKATEAELAERVAERTAELERSNQELDQFAYVASHDLKAPLRAIENLASWIVQDAADVLPEASREHLELLQGRVERMEALLDSLLTYSRAGRHVGMAEEVDTAALVRDVAGLLDPPEAFTVEVDDGLPTLVTYRAPLELVFRNLLGNAVKHGPPDGHVRVAARAAEGDGASGDESAFVAFTVADEGPGIAPEFHERIFGLFQTLRPRDEVEGSGMGLSVVKKAVESLGGSIRVASAEGAGTTFTFTWPRSV